jgi:hypothetical protein
MAVIKCTLEVVGPGKNGVLRRQDMSISAGGASNRMIEQRTEGSGRKVLVTPRKRRICINEISATGADTASCSV